METSDSFTSAPAWYLVQAKPRQESVALDHLQRQGYEAYLPIRRAEKIRRGRRLMVEEPLFTRYLFVRLASGFKDKAWGPIRSTLGVSDLVRFGTTPASAPESLIAALKAQEAIAPADKLFQPGERVRIEQGAFRGLEAIFQQDDGDARAIVLIELLAKKVRVPLEVQALSTA